jgi:RNA polymerase sigma-70 factor (ECF subfamily)
MKKNEQIDDRIYVIQAQLGDDDAFMKLVDHYSGRLLYYIRRLLEDADRSDDVLQEVWLMVYKKINTVRDASAFSVWLYHTARNRAIRLLRDESRYVFVEQYDESDLIDDDSESLLFDDINKLHRVLTTLSPEQKEAIVLRFFEEMSYQEISAIVGCSIGTVRSRIHYAKQELRKKMKG